MAARTDGDLHPGSYQHQANGLQKGRFQGQGRSLGLQYVTWEQEAVRAHLCTSEVPLSPNQNQTADCGMEIERAELVFCWDDMDVGSTIPVSTVMLCSKCVVILLSKREIRPRYVYGIASRPTEQ